MNEQLRDERREAGDGRQIDTAGEADERGPALDAGEAELDDASREAVEEEVAEEGVPFEPGPTTFIPMGGAPVPFDDDPKRELDL
jgi:hypothetical protein